MILDRKTVAHGSIPVGKVMSLESTFKTTAYNTTPAAPGLEWGTLAAGTDGYVLTCSAAAAEGVAWAAPATNGTVTSVTYTGDGVVFSSTPTSAVTASGTLTPAMITQAANIVLAGPTSGATAVAPTFRAIVNADLPASGRGSGTVTSVTLTGDGAVLATGPSTAVTASGTLTAALATQSANVVLAGRATAGTALAPTFRSLVTADLPSSIVISGSIATNGVGSAPAQADFPGTSGGDDATVVNKIVTILVNLGFCKAS